MKRICLLFCIILLAACHKKDNNNGSLKPTQTGQNIVAFTVNGQQHVYKGIDAWNNPIGILFNIYQYRDSNKVIEIFGSDLQTNHDEFQFVVNVFPPVLNTPYPIINSFDGSFYDFRDQSYIEHYYYVDSAKSKIIFTRFDAAVASGTFEYYGIDSGKTVSLTNGFFDVSLH